MLPYSAQGGAMAIEDAWVLGEVLAGAADLVAALACYSQRRVARATRVPARAARNANIFHRSGRVSRAVGSQGPAIFTDTIAFTSDGAVRIHGHATSKA
jgi:salicylate hydroxylase